MKSLFTLVTFCGILLFHATSVFSESTGGRSPVWMNYGEAVEQAKSSSKPLLLFFTGSDWCGWCSKLEEEVFNTPEFSAAAGNKFLFVKLDFPLYTNQDPQLKAQNKQLQQQFDVRSFPTVLLLDSNRNQKILMTGYRAGGGKAYADYLLKTLNDYSSYKQKVSAVNSLKLSSLAQN